MSIAMPALAARDFSVWLEDVRREARAQGVSSQTLDQATTGISVIPRVIELDRKQPEGTMTFAQYKVKIVSDARISQGRRMYAEHRDLLNTVAAQYGVPPQYIVALWGIETSYGNFTGGFNVVAALATLAYDGRRSAFFRKELMNALKIIDEGHIAAADMKGSWAGAMGQNQFMPSSFNAYAVDGNGDGRRDIWGALPDVFASSSNYLARSGWNANQTWGQAVSLPRGFDEKMASLKVKYDVETWRRMGVRNANGDPLPILNGVEASVVAPDGVDGDAYLVYDNYRVIMKWNRSTYFATSVGLLADAIAQ